MNDAITLTIPAKPDYLLTARLTVSSVASRMGFDINDVEDIKTAAAECILIVMHRKKYGEINLKVINSSDKIQVRVQGVSGDVPDIDIKTDDSSLSRYLIEALADESSFEEDGEISSIIFTKKLQR